MESIGEKIRVAREGKSISLEQAARDTHIAKGYLSAIEEEAFTEFPGEPYLLGFLRTYSEYLGLDPEGTVALYRNMKLQEQPVPVEELIPRRNPWPLILSIVGVVLGAGAVTALVLLFANGILELPSFERPEPEPVVEVRELEAEFLEDRFELGEIVRVPGQTAQVPLTIVAIGDDLLLDSPDEQYRIAEGDDRLIDVDSNGRADLRVLVRQLTPSATPPTAVVRFDRVVASPDRPTPESAAGDAEPETILIPRDNDAEAAGIGSTNHEHRER